MRNYVIADNRDITRAGLISYIKEIDTDFSLTEVNSYIGLLDELRMNPNSVVITDYSLFDFSSLAHMLNIKSGAKKSNWLLFSEEPGEHFLRQLLLTDDSISVVLKNSSKKNIMDALFAVKEGDVYWCDYAESVMRSDIENGRSIINLTASEKNILHEIALGKTTKEIALEKNLSFHTVNTHRRNIYMYVHQHCQSQLSDDEKNALEKTFSLLVAHNAKQPCVFVHRDYHSPNLLVCDQDMYGPNPGIIDFQDAVNGPISYDLASLIMDARTTWEEPQQLDWAIRYWQMARDAKLAVPDDFANFHTDYGFMGLQRNLRILGVFARLSIRDDKDHYLQHMPRVNAYVRQVANRYLVFKPLLRLLDRLDNIEHKVGYTF